MRAQKFFKLKSRVGMGRPRKIKPVGGKEVGVITTEPVVSEEEGSPSMNQNADLTRRQRVLLVKLCVDMALAGLERAAIAMRDELLLATAEVYKKLNMAQKLFEVASLGGARRVQSFVPVPCAAGPILRSFQRARVPQRDMRISWSRRAQWCAAARVRVRVARVRSCRALWASTGRHTAKLEKSRAVGCQFSAPQ